ncbi:hypothetical protein [uncultured Gammaproteobacteria bacterium]|nr:hypothetical protein [uncultured Gammaproteobacteria bacterium]
MEGQSLTTKKLLEYRDAAHTRTQKTKQKINK